MRDGENFVVFKMDGSIKFSQHVSFRCLVSEPLFLLLLAIGKIREISLMIIVDLSGISICKAAIRISDRII